MGRSHNYGSINPPDKPLLHDDEASFSDESKKEAEVPPNPDNAISIEDALTDAGFHWPQVKILIVMSIIQTGVCAQLEAVAIIGPELLCTWELSGAQESVIGSIYFVAAIFGSLVWGQFADKYGRKLTLQIYCALSAVSLIGVSCSPEIITISFSLFATGFARGAFSITLTVATEIVGRHHRTTAGTFIFIAGGIGAILGSVLAYVTIPADPRFWRIYFAELSFLSVIAFIGMFFCQETPRYLLVSGDMDKALKVIQSFNENENKDIILIHQKSEKRGSFRELTKSSENVYHVIIIAIVGFCIRGNKMGTNFLYLESLQNPNAENCFLVESYDIEKECERLSSNDYALQILSSTSALLAGFISKPMADILGRRRSILVGGYITIIQTSLFFFCKPKIAQTFLSVTTRTVINSANSVTNFYDSEVFPTSIRSLALGITMACSDLGSAIGPFVVQYISKISYPAAVGYFVFTTAVWVVLMHCVDKETKGVAQEDLVESDTN